MDAPITKINTFNEIDYDDVLRNISNQIIEQFKTTNPEIVQKLREKIESEPIQAWTVKRTCKGS